MAVNYLARKAEATGVGGRIVIAHFDWLPLPNNVVDRTEQLILEVNPNWTMGGGNGIYPQWFQDLGHARFGQIETFSFDLHQPYSHQAWRGRLANATLE